MSDDIVEPLQLKLLRAYNEIRQLREETERLKQLLHDIRPYVITDWEEKTTEDDAVIERYKQFVVDDGRRKIFTEIEKKIKWLREENERLKQIKKRLLRLADRYCTEDGAPGDLSTTWGWRQIGDTIRGIVRQAEDEG